MWITTFASKVLQAFAAERRRVVSDWRILIVSRRVAHAENAPLPRGPRADEIRRALLARGDIVPVEGAEGVFVVDVPYANLLDVSEEQVVQEANPWAVFGFLTALVHHGLTDLPPKDVFAIRFAPCANRDRLPLGTTPDDWVDLDFPPPRRPRKLRDTDIIWTEMRKRLEFGIEVGYSAGLAVYRTDPERTLLDALRMPDKCGGIAKVLRAWRSADGLDLERLVQYTDHYGVQNLRQRVGYVLEKLGHTHPALERWRRGLHRGGSVKLVASEPYSAAYSPGWNLSLNVPPSVLAIMD